MILIGALLLGVSLWLVRRPQDAPTAKPAAPIATGGEQGNSSAPDLPGSPAGAPENASGALAATAPAAVVAAPAPLPAPNPPSAVRQSPAAPPLPSAARPAPDSPDPALAAVEGIARDIREYRNRFGGNPVGNNAEIVRELDGGNAKGAIYLSSDLRRINTAGELVDEWGTPYFFHQESREVMEVRSAGADRVMWTPDDLTAR